MTRNTAVTVRLPGASSAPTTNTWTCSHTRLENTGANFTISRVRATGTVSMPHLFWHKSEGQLTNLSLCFQSPLQLDKVELKREEKTQNAIWETRLAEIQRENERLTAELQRPVQESAPLDIELQILVLIAHNPDCTTGRIAAHLGVSPEKILHHRDELVERRYVDYGLSAMDEEYYQLTPKGRKFLNDKQLL